MTWAERRKIDLMRSHSARVSKDSETANRLERLVDELVQYEALSHAMEAQGASESELERIEDRAWPVRECIRQMYEELPPFWVPAPAYLM